MSIDDATPEEWYRSQQLDPINLHNVDQAFDKATRVDIKDLKDYIKSKQVGGDHYKGTIEPWEAMLAWGLDPWACNVIKYVQRHRKKGGKQDLEKALHYLEFMIENYEAVGHKYYDKK